MARSPVPALATVEKRKVSLAIVSAICLSLPLFIPATFPLAWFGLVFLMAAINSSHWKVALMASSVFGLAFHGAANYWLVPTVAGLEPYTESQNQAMEIWAIVAFVALLLWQSLFAAIFGLIAWSVFRFARGIQAAVGIGSAWLLMEWLRSIGIFGYPWALLASTQVAFLPLVQWVSFIGSFGLSGLLAFVNALFFEWLRFRDRRFLLAAFISLASLSFVGWIEMERMKAVLRKSPHLTVAAVQGNFGKERWRQDVTFAELEEILRTHLRLSEQAAKRGARLIVWSETALPWSLREDGRWGYGAREIQAFANKKKVALFVGASEVRSGKSYNACFVFAPEKALSGNETYHKIRLVPFGEYIPGKEIFPWLGKILPHTPVETTSGNSWGITVLNLENVKVRLRVTTAICFESLFPFHLRKLVSIPSSQFSPANLLVIITNDSWFGNTLAPRHHARVAILRAVELRRGVVRGAGTGISEIVSPTGKVLQMADWNQRRIIVASLPIVIARSVYQILGDLPFVAFSLLALALTLFRAKSKGKD